MKLKTEIQTAMASWLVSRKGFASHRQLLVISLEEYDAAELAEQCCETFNSSLWIGERHTERASLAKTQYKQALGRSIDVVVYNAFKGIKPNALFAIEGCVNKGGVLIMLCPSMSTWKQHEAQSTGIKFSFGEKHSESLFISYLINNITSDETVAFVDKQGYRFPFSAYETVSSTLTTPAVSNKQFSLTQGQHIAYQHITEHLSTKLPFKAIVTGRRGRGKSTLLGCLAAKAIDQGCHVTVCASVKLNCKSVFTQAQKELDEKQLNSLEYLPPDRMSEVTQHPKRVVIIDEAASIAPSILLEAFYNSENVIIATTEIGYEGSGLGFDKKIKPLIQDQYDSVYSAALTEPVRWYQGDPLERLFINIFEPLSPPLCSNTYESNIQDSELSKGIATQTLASNDARRQTREISYSRLDKQKSENINTLLKVYRLLKDAHYQTTPDDLMRLLDSNDQHVYAASQGSRILAVAIIIEEGITTNKKTTDDIVHGKRRLQGHLVSQTLAVSLQSLDVLSARNWRVNRIAVNERDRYKGVGTKLLNFIEQDAIERSVSYMSTSFGLEKKLYGFWCKNDFISVKLGIKRDTSSGLQSILMIKPVSKASKHMLASLSVHFQICITHMGLTSTCPSYLLDQQLNLSESQTLTLNIPLNTIVPVSLAVDVTHAIKAKLVLFCKGHLSLKDSLPYLYIFSELHKRFCNSNEKHILLNKLLQKGQHKQDKDAFECRLKEHITEVFQSHKKSS